MSNPSNVAADPSRPNCNLPPQNDEQSLYTRVDEKHPRRQKRPQGHNNNHFDEIIPHPEEVHHRNLILCFDGTGDQFDDDNSNIVQLYSILKKDDPARQLCYYQPGIGTYTIPQIAKPWMASLHKTLDMMVGKDLNAHVMAGYEFVMQNFLAGDRIFIFGFSRGAYTARALAGMIHKVGLLPPSNYQQVPFAYQMYKRADKKGWEQSTAFKKAFCVDIDIEFLGVWDTVGSVGIIPRRLPFSAANNHIKYFRHAIALDERRARFKVNLWNKPSDEEHALGIKKGTMPRGHGAKKESTGDKRDLEDREAMFAAEKAVKAKAKAQKKADGMDDSEIESLESDEHCHTNIEEVWFSGAHADVGGGSVANNTRHSLARISLRWMVRQTFICDTGIMFHKSMFHTIGLEPNTLYPTVQPRPPRIPYTPETLAGQFDPPMNKAVNYKTNVKAEKPFKSEEMEDMLDSLTPMYDQLRMARHWWVLEVLPNKERHQKSDKSWKHTRTINLGGPRWIPDHYKDDIKIHRAVKIRMDAQGFFKDKHYKPAVKMDFEPQWVD